MDGEFTARIQTRDSPKSLVFMDEVWFVALMLHEEILEEDVVVFLLLFPRLIPTYIDSFRTIIYIVWNNILKFGICPSFDIIFFNFGDRMN